MVENHLTTCVENDTDAKQWKMGLLYLVTCWSGFSIAMTMIDAMIAVPMKPDENGIIYL